MIVITVASHVALVNLLICDGLYWTAVGSDSEVYAPLTSAGR